ncbi:phosphoribosylformylglycinamidine cyclo-ligase [Candidatus Synechococcus spongiarum]|uniref:Phosphoribosylformylglycinamidine cyclo-ligase n=1 Tax=Candidatus Synechococcus spongiarum TaxID=431041 RepID=A0A161KK06_9SYNE|nr:phosphoribosylformylglycinamidine cyclo-ligase [Candidatus Synechococcus spongiarum]CZB22572.1 Phosphoribosylformylglycinamidine cyclo-ligase (EC 6.3.3.1) [Candidatus Synechococcus spongiarum]
MDYRSAGVDIEEGNAFVARIRTMAASTRRPEVVGSLGGFGGLCRVPAGLQQPLLVSGADGVGTKLALAQDWGCHRQVGVDLVAMSVNDVITSGADPLFFLDYIASGRLMSDPLVAAVDGMAWACRISGCALLGGETAEMPGFYEDGRYDLAGFCVGVVDAPALVDGRHIQPGDQVIAVASSGPHSNGFSLIRRVLDHTGVDPHALCPEPGCNRSLAQQLMEPTRLYAPLVRQLRRQAVPLHGMVHITGGGLPGNLPRCLPEDADLHVALDADSWSIPPLFHWLQQEGQIPEADLWSTFNLGIGFCLVVPPDRVEDTLVCCRNCGERSWCLGEVLAGQGPVEGLPKPPHVAN